MKKQFDCQAEKKYYTAPPAGLVVTPNHVVEAQMQFCTGQSIWPSLINNSRVLEIGAGECSYLKYFLERATPNLYIAQDLIAERMSVAKELGHYNRVVYIASDGLVLPFKDQSFDLCMAFGLLHHIPNLEDFLQEITRVLKPSGNFIFRDPYANNPLIWLKYRFGHKSDNEFPISGRQLKLALRNAGLEIRFLNRFWLRFPKLPPGPWSVNIGGMASKRSRNPSRR